MIYKMHYICLILAVGLAVFAIDSNPAVSALEENEDNLDGVSVNSVSPEWNKEEKESSDALLKRYYTSGEIDRETYLGRMKEFYRIQDEFEENVKGLELSFEGDALEVKINQVRQMRDMRLYDLVKELEDSAEDEEVMILNSESK